MTRASCLWLLTARRINLFLSLSLSLVNEHRNCISILLHCRRSIHWLWMNNNNTNLEKIDQKSSSQANNTNSSNPVLVYSIHIDAVSAELHCYVKSKTFDFANRFERWIPIRVSFDIWELDAYWFYWWRITIKQIEKSKVAHNIIVLQKTVVWQWRW